MAMVFFSGMRAVSQNGGAEPITGLIPASGRVKIYPSLQGMIMSAIEICRIFISAGHGFVGQAPEAARDHAMQSVAQVECVAGSGLLGDRYFDHKDNYKGQITFFSADVFDGVRREVGNQACPPWAMRRNVMLSGIDLNALIGKQFTIGTVRFFGTEECAPCRWMDRAIGAGAREYLKGQGGLRARILSSGLLSQGPASLCVQD
jgi:hypothetical protein